jgi:hypothetical protein
MASADVTRERIQLGQATRQEKLDFLETLSTTHCREHRELAENLVSDESPLVRYYAIQTLVMDLQFKDDESVKLCWRVLRGDDSEDVRSMSASALGSIFFATRRSDVADELAAAFRAETDNGVRWSILDSIRALLALLPAQLTVSRNRLLKESPPSSAIDELLRAFSRVN